MASKDYRRATGALDISVPWFRSIAGLWLLSIAALSFVSVDPSFSGPKQWVVDGSMHAAIFLALALVPGLFVRSASTLIVAALITLGLAVGLETAQAARNQAPLERADIFANLLGFAAGTILVVFVRWRVRRRRVGTGRLARELHQKYGFSTADARLASHLASGGSLAGHADFVGHSVDAVRAAAAQIYERTKTQGQAEFMQLILGEKPGRRVRRDR